MRRPRARRPPGSPGSQAASVIPDVADDAGQGTRFGGSHAPTPPARRTDRPIRLGGRDRIPDLARGAADGGTWGSFPLSGQEAREFRVPSDVVAVRSWRDSSGRSVTRYQQMVDGTSVAGGQITVTRDANGTIVAAIGAYFPGLQPKNKASIGKGQARAIVEREIGRGGQWRTTLRLDPATASLFYEVQSLRADSRPRAVDRRQHRRRPQGLRCGRRR